MIVFTDIDELYLRTLYVVRSLVSIRRDRWVSQMHEWIENARCQIIAFAPGHNRDAQSRLQDGNNFTIITNTTKTNSTDVDVWENSGYRNV